MKSIAKLKDKARLHEQEERWSEAIEAYLQVVRAGEDREGEVELSVFNRIGDLYLRLARTADAVTYYEQAAERYAEAGLYNNAIALCNKALRYMPDRTHLLRRLGEYCAAQGFLIDARRWFLEYAEQMMLGGAEKEAFQALEEFAVLSADPAIREVLGRHLRAQGSKAEAQTQLEMAYEQRIRAGQAEAAEALRAELTELDPAIDFVEIEARVAAKAAEEAERRAAESAFDPTSLGEIAIETTASAAGIERAEESDAAASASDADGTAALADDPFESDAAVMEDPVEAETGEDAAVGDGVEAVESEGVHAIADEDEPEAEPLPLLDLEDEPTLESSEPEPAQEAQDWEAMLIEDGADAVDPTSGARWSGGLATDLDPPDDPASLIDDARALAAVGQTSEAVRRLERAHETLAAAERYGEAMAAVDALLLLAPEDVNAHQSRVQYAVMANDDQRQIAAYMALGECLERSGAKEKAQTVYRHVLEAWPEHEQAREALGPTAPQSDPGAPTGLEPEPGPLAGAPTPTPTPTAHAEDDDYVDLGGLLREEVVEPTTRFVVPEEEPSGDEERDFAEMLAQFKAQLSEHVAADDQASHYDLGLAFKEMGLIDEAIAEFQTALRAGKAPLKVYEELGHCFMLKSEPKVAVKILQRALELGPVDEMELLGVYYHIGRCYEELGDPERARDAYERVLGLDLNFGDVSDRLARL